MITHWPRPGKYVFQCYWPSIYSSLPTPILPRLVDVGLFPKLIYKNSILIKYESVLLQIVLQKYKQTPFTSLWFFFFNLEIQIFNIHNWIYKLKGVIKIPSFKSGTFSLASSLYMLRCLECYRNDSEIYKLFQISNIVLYNITKFSLYLTW